MFGPLSDRKLKFQFALTKKWLPYSICLKELKFRIGNNQANHLVASVAHPDDEESTDDNTDDSDDDPADDQSGGLDDDQPDGEHHGDQPVDLPAVDQFAELFAQGDSDDEPAAEPDGEPDGAPAGAPDLPDHMFRPPRSPSPGEEIHWIWWRGEWRHYYR